MAHVFLLNSTVVFWPERNVLYAKSDETKRITLSNPATRCLLLLIQQQGQVIERDYFFEHVWYINGAQVTNNTFYQNISLLRRAFKELGLNEELIVTVPKVGIRTEPQLEVLEQKIEEPLSDLSVTPSVTPVNTVTKSLRMHSLCWILAGVVCCVIAAIVTWEAQFDPKLSRYVSLGVGRDATGTSIRMCLNLISTSSLSKQIRWIVKVIPGFISRCILISRGSPH